MLGPLEDAVHLEEGDGVIQAGGEDHLSRRVELHRGQETLTRVSVVSVQTFL